MRKLVLPLLGLTATAAGILINTKRIERLTTPQVVLNEVTWIPAVTGAAIAAASLTWQKPLGWAFGTLGAGLAAVPLTQIRAAARDMEKSMAEGFGADYLQAIPAEVVRRMSHNRLSLKNSFGGTMRVNSVRVTEDIVYVQRSTRSLKLDVYQPTTPPIMGDSYPTIIALHGGGWRSGNKREYFAPQFRYLAAQGYVIFDAQYRFTNELRWPAQLDDVRFALRWVNDHAREYRVNPEQRILLGRSAGGHLALQAAYRATGEYTDTAVNAVVAYYPPTNLRITGKEHDDRVVALCGGTSYDLPDVYADASPLDFAQGAHIPPTLLIHGYQDDVVAPSHSELLLNKLKINRTPAAVLRVPWARHGFDAVMFGVGAQLTQYYLDRFLAWSSNK